MPFEERWELNFYKEGLVEDYEVKPFVEEDGEEEEEEKADASVLEITTVNY